MATRRWTLLLVVTAVAIAGCSKKPAATGGGSSPTAAASTSPTTSAAPTTSPSATTAASPTASTSRSASPSPTATASNAKCTTVTAAEINAAFGTGVGAPQVIDNPPISVCTYSGGTPPKSVIVRFQGQEDPSVFASGKAGFNSNGEPTTDVAGFGDEAYSYVLSGSGGAVASATLVARKATLEVLITGPVALSAVETLMQQVLAQV